MLAADLLKKIRLLSLYLFASGALNIFLVAFMVFFLIYERPPTPYCELKPAVEKGKARITWVSPTNSALLLKYKSAPYEELNLKLSKTGLVEDGFTERDLALGILVTFHDFDLDKALGSLPLPTQKRVLSFNEGKDQVALYPSLTEEQFEAILNFAKLEKWPFKSRGLFNILHFEQHKNDPSLFEAFYLTSEFQSVKSLFKKNDIEDLALLKMVIEGDFGILKAFHEKQKTLQDLSDENRQRLLLAYINAQSKHASTLILKTDLDFVAKRLSDATLVKIIRLLDENTEEASKFLTLLAASPRSDGVKTLAIAKYKELTGAAWEPLVSRVPIATKKPAIEKVVAFSPKEAKKDLVYVVQDGDSLWKIAKRFKVSIEELRSLNHLKTDRLKLGTPLKVPDRTRPDAKGGTSKASST